MEPSETQEDDATSCTSWHTGKDRQTDRQTELRSSGFAMCLMGRFTSPLQASASSNNTGMVTVLPLCGFEEGSLGSI